MLCENRGACDANGLGKHIGALEAGHIDIWNTLKSLNIVVSIRKDISYLNAVKNYMAERSLTLQAVQTELQAFSGATPFDDWMVAKLVPYERNGFVLNKAKIDNCFNTHHKVVQAVENLKSGGSGTVQGGVKGGHAESKFLETQASAPYTNGKRVVLEGTPTPIPGMPGWYAYKYKTIAQKPGGILDISQGPPPTPKFNGNPCGPFIGTKTVYVEGVVSEQSVKEMGYRIFKEGMEMPVQRVQVTNQYTFSVSFGGQNYIGYMDLNGEIKTWFLKI